MLKTSQYIIGEQLLKNDNGVLTVRDEDEKKFLDRVGMG